jgi:hypothetical protein
VAPKSNVPPREAIEVAAVGPFCGFESCHGLDLSCTSDPPKPCSKIYQIGDLCRRYASCEMMEGKCELAVTPEFAACKACVEKCQVRLEGATGLLECERACRQGSGRKK